MLVVFNPDTEPVKKTIRVNLYYTGLTDVAQVRDASGNNSRLELDRRFRVRMDVTVPAKGMTWYLIW